MRIPPSQRTGARVVLTTLTALLATGPAAHAAVSTSADEADATRSNLRHEQWALEAVEAEDAWEHSQGAGVTVALLGTGVDGAHPDLDGRVVDGPDLTGSENAAPPGEHGTMMAGIIAAGGHGIEHTGGVLGVAPEAGVLSVRVRQEGLTPAPGDTEAWEARADAVASGIREAVTSGAQVIALFVDEDGGPEETGEAERWAIDFARERGVVIIAPAGRPQLPDEGVVTVGAVNSDLTPVIPAADPSALESATLTAPGTDIITTSVNGEYAEASGNGAAAAIVAGVAALIRAAYPQLRPDQVTEALLAGADAGDGAPGAGVISAARSLEAASRIAEDVPPFDESLVADSEEDGSPPGWTYYVAGATVAVLAVAVVVVARFSRRRGTRRYDGS